MELAALFLSIVKAIPAVRDIFLKVVDLYHEQLNAADSGAVTKNAKQRDALLSVLKLPGLENEKRNEIRRILYDVSRK
jgi:hypothetical protein